MGHELSFVALVEGGVEPDRLTALALGPELLAEAARVVADQAVGGLQNGARRAVVLLEAKQRRLRVVAHELLQVRHACTTKPVDGLVVVADYERVAGVRDGVSVTCR